MSRNFDWKMKMAPVKPYNRIAKIALKVSEEEHSIEALKLIDEEEAIIFFR